MFAGTIYTFNIICLFMAVGTGGGAGGGNCPPNILPTKKI